MNSRTLFFIAGIYGLLVLTPQYFLETRIGHDQPPAITHPEYFYGFVGVALSWQIAFLIIATDPPRYRALIIPGILEKLAFGIASFVLFQAERLAPIVLVFASIDLLFAVLFLVSYLQLGRPKWRVKSDSRIPDLDA